jgi:hypothetical protein
LYLFYFDESGNARMNAKSMAAYPWFALGAVGIHDSQWWAINSTLTTLKTRYFPKVPVSEIEIKSTALRSWGTPRARWPWMLLNAGQAQSFVEELYAIYANYDLPLFAAGLDKVAHHRTGPNPPHPYQVTFAALLQSINRFLTERNEVGLCFLDEFKGMERQVISWYTWRRRRGGETGLTVARIVERPVFVVSHDSQMISMADIFIYNVYRQFRENDPTYPYFVRLRPQLIELMRLPENKEPPGIGGSG